MGNRLGKGRGGPWLLGSRRLDRGGRFRWGDRLLVALSLAWALLKHRIVNDWLFLFDLVMGFFLSAVLFLSVVMFLGMEWLRSDLGFLLESTNGRKGGGSGQENPVNTCHWGPYAFSIVTSPPSSGIGA